jgi:hypothetical protein
VHEVLQCFFSHSSSKANAYERGMVSVQRRYKMIGFMILICGNEVSNFLRV